MFLVKWLRLDVHGAKLMQGCELPRYQDEVGLDILQHQISVR